MEDSTKEKRVLTHFIITAKERAPLSGCHSVCRYRRGEAPEGSPVFSQDIKGRSPEDSGKEKHGKDIRPRQGVAHTQSFNQCDTLTGSRIACEARPTGLRGYASRPRDNEAGTRAGVQHRLCIPLSDSSDKV